MNLSRRPTCKAFTRIELVVILTVLILLTAVLGVSMVKAREKARRINCLNNLKQVALAFRLWPDEAPEYVMAVSTNFGGTREVASEVWRTFLAMSNELQTPKILICQSDSRDPAASWASLKNINTSYFACLDAGEVVPDVILAGDRNMTNIGSPQNCVLTLSSNDTVGWTDAIHRGGGNIALSDGSARLVDQAGLQFQVNRSVQGMEEAQKYLTNRAPVTLRLAMPE